MGIRDRINTIFEEAQFEAGISFYSQQKHELEGSVERDLHKKITINPLIDRHIVTNDIYKKIPPTDLILYEADANEEILLSTDPEGGSVRKKTINAIWNNSLGTGSDIESVGQHNHNFSEIINRSQTMALIDSGRPTINYPELPDVSALFSLLFNFGSTASVTYHHLSKAEFSRRDLLKSIGLTSTGILATNYLVPRNGYSGMIQTL